MKKPIAIMIVACASYIATAGKLTVVNLAAEIATSDIGYFNFPHGTTVIPLTDSLIGGLNADTFNSGDTMTAILGEEMQRTNDYVAYATGIPGSPASIIMLKVTDDERTNAYGKRAFFSGFTTIFTMGMLGIGARWSRKIMGGTGEATE